MKTDAKGRTPTYNSWRSMRSRCLDKNAKGFKYWGGKGVTICERWDKYSNFLEDMGERPEGHVLARKGDKGNYEPGNVTWKLLAENTREMQHAKGEKVASSKLTEEQVLKIRDLKEKGCGVRQLGRLYGVDHNTISAIVNRRTWKHI
jgi:hypothetical protein